MDRSKRKRMEKRKPSRYHPNLFLFLSSRPCRGGRWKKEGSGERRPISHSLTFPSGWKAGSDRSDESFSFILVSSPTPLFPFPSRTCIASHRAQERFRGSYIDPHVVTKEPSTRNEERNLRSVRPFLTKGVRMRRIRIGWDRIERESTLFPRERWILSERGMMVKKKEEPFRSNRKVRPFGVSRSKGGKGKRDRKRGGEERKPSIPRRRSLDASLPFPMDVFDSSKPGDTLNLVLFYSLPTIHPDPKGKGERKKKDVRYKPSIPGLLYGIPFSPYVSFLRKYESGTFPGWMGRWIRPDRSGGETISTNGKKETEGKGT